MYTETFFEQLYARKKTPADYLIQTLIVIASVLLAVFFYFALMGLKMSISLMLATLAIAGIVYCGHKLFIRFNIEFEYIYLNGELDVDKVIAKADRKRIVTVKAEDFMRFGEYTAQTEQSLSSMGISKKLDFRSNTGKPVYYAVFKHKVMGTTLMLFEPDDRILDDIKRRVKL